MDTYPYSGSLRAIGAGGQCSQGLLTANVSNNVAHYTFVVA